MNSERLGNSDEEFASLLAEYDELLAQGGHLPLGPAAFPDDVQPEVRNRLQDAARCLELLEQLRQLEPVDPETDGRPKPPESESHTRRLGRFEIVREVGRGSYGIVFLATDPLLGRQIALKVPRPETVLSPELNERFVREAKVAAGLDHAGIVPVLEAAQIGPVSYIATAYCEGPSLTQWLRRQTEPVPVETAAGIVQQLADAVEHAHQQGVLHRDIKPGNILLDDTAPLKKANCELPFSPKLTDFGLAKVLELQEDQTRSGIIIGTPQYMAPEQADGRSRDVGPHTDVHALGCILYELLAGKPPFVGSSLLETLQKVLNDDPPPMTRIRRTIPRDLEAICLKCLEKDHARRYPDAAALAADLGRFLNGEPTAARPLSLVGSSWKWIRRRPTAAALLFVTVAASIALLVGAAWHVQSLNQALTLADELRSEAEHQGGLAKQREREVRERLYAADMKLAQNAWTNGNVAQVLGLLDAHRPQGGQANLRSFEWRHLWRLSHGDRWTIQAHDGDVYDSQFSPDGKLLATVSKDGTAALWDVEDGRLVARLQGHTSEVNSVRFSPDGRRLATCSDDKTVRIWHMPSGREQAILHGHENYVYCLAMSPDGRTLASGSRDQTVRIWDVETGQSVRTLSEHSGTVGSLTFSSDGTRLATSDGTIRLWDVDSWKQTGSLPQHAGTVLAIAFSHDGQTIATTDDERSVKLWNVESGSRIATLEGHENVVQRLAFAPDDSFLVSASKDQTIRIWDVEQKQPLRVLRGHTSRAWSVSISPDGSSIASTDADGRLKLWTHPSERPTHYVQQVSRPIYAAALADSDNTLATSTAISRESVALWNLSQSGFLAGETIDYEHGIPCMSFSPVANQLIGGGIHGSIVMLNRAKHQASTEERFAGNTLAVAHSPDGALLAAGGDDDVVRLWQVDGRERVAELPGHSNDVLCLAFSPDGRTLASGSQDQTIRLWDVDERNEAQVLRGHQAGIDSVAFSPDGNQVATAGADRMLKLWNAATGENIATLQNNCGRIHAVAFSPDGRTLAAGCENGSVNLWDVKTRQQTLTLTEHDGPVRFVQFTSGGEILVSAGMTSSGGGRLVAWFAANEDGHEPSMDE